MRGWFVYYIYRPFILYIIIYWSFYYYQTNNVPQGYVELAHLRSPGDTTNNGSLILSGSIEQWTTQNFYCLNINTRESLAVVGWYTSASAGIYPVIYQAADNTYYLYLCCDVEYCSINFKIENIPLWTNNVALSIENTLSNVSSSPNGTLVWSPFTNNKLVLLQTINTIDATIFE